MIQPVEKIPKVVTRRWVTLSGLSRAGLVLLVILGVGGVFLWFYVPIEVRDSINQRLAHLPDYKGHVGKVKINILTLSVDIIDVDLIKRSADLKYPLFFSHQINVAVHWEALMHGNLRNTVTIYEPTLNFIAGPSEGSSQLSVTDLITEIKNLALFKINRLIVTNGDVYFHDFHSEPPLSIDMDEVEVTASNLTNGNRSSSHLPCEIVATGRPLRAGTLDLKVLSNLDLAAPTFSEQLEVKKVPATTLNAGMQKYLNVRAKSGTIELYSVMKSDGGDFHGYAKPFLEKLEFEPTPEDKGTPIELWSDLMNGVKKLFEDHYDTVATRVELTGSFKDPKVSAFQAVMGAIRNAWFEALKRGFEPDKGLSDSNPASISDPDSDSDSGKPTSVPKKTEIDKTVTHDSSKPR